MAARDDPFCVDYLQLHRHRQHPSYFPFPLIAFSPLFSLSSFPLLQCFGSFFHCFSLSWSQDVCFPVCLSFSKALSYFFLSSPSSWGLRYATPSVSNLQKRQGHLFPHGLALNHLSKTQPVYSLCDNRADDGGGVSLWKACWAVSAAG